jgi:hypothetical protein
LRPIGNLLALYSSTIIGPVETVVKGHQGIYASLSK